MEFNIEQYHLKSSSFFDLLTPEETRLVKAQIGRKEYKKGEYIFKERSHSKGVYLMRKGKVKIFSTSGGGKQSIIYIYRKSDYFGYRPLLANEPHPVSAVAMDNVVMSFIPRDLFLNLLSDSSVLAKELLSVLSKEFSVWINRITTFSQYGVKERVALSLLILNEIYRRNHNSVTKTRIAINRDDFAAFVGTAKETLVRMLRTFKDDKIITSQGTKIMIMRPRILLEIVEEM